MTRVRTYWTNSKTSLMAYVRLGEDKSGNTLDGWRGENWHPVLTPGVATLFTDEEAAAFILANTREGHEAASFWAEDQ